MQKSSPRRIPGGSQDRRSGGIKTGGAGSPQVDVYYEVEGAALDRYSDLKGAGVRLQRALASADGEVRLGETCSAAIGACVGPYRITRQTLSAAPGLRLIANYTIGCNNIDIEAATELGVLVVNNPAESNWGGVAETTLAYMLSLLKRVRERDASVRAGTWNKPDDLLGRYVGARRSDGYQGLVIGIVGFGRTGRRLAELLAPWGVRVIAHDPLVDLGEFVARQVQPVAIDELLAVADVVTLHCELTESTRGLLGAREFSLMKPEAILINSARAPIVDQAALFEALASGGIAGAALDVFEQEPLLSGHPLLALSDRVLLSPHMFGMSQGVSLGASRRIVEMRVVSALRGMVPDDVVNPKALPLWDARFGRRSLLIGEVAP